MDDSDLDQLRSLIIGPLVEEITTLQGRVHSLEQQLLETDQRAVAVGEVLNEAAVSRRRLHPEADQGFSEAIRPEVELAIHQSSRTDVAIMSEALYPVLGPAIRKMIADVFSQGEASSFVVDRIILFDRSTGLPMQQFARPGLDAEDTDVISGMLDALRSFVEDAFDATEVDGLNDLRVGDVSVLVEWGPLAGLAVVTRGIVPGAFRDVVRQRLEDIHRVHGGLLSSFDGDDSALDAIIPDLVALERVASPEPSSRWRIVAAVLGVAVIAIALFVLAVMAVVRIFGV